MSAAFMGVSSVFDPRISGGVLARIVRVEVDEAALDQPVADLEHIAPAAGAPLGHPGAPRPIGMLAVARSPADQQVAGREDPVEALEVMGDGLAPAAEVPEHLADLLTTLGDAPLGKVDLRIGGKKIEDRA